MATYAIGDLQGCYDELNDLLDLIAFDTNTDQIWFAGDLVNRGPHSLACLKLAVSLGKSASAVLGNHDLHLLAIAAGYGNKQKQDTLDELLHADDKNELLQWLVMQPLLIKNASFTMVHAGIHPHWDIVAASHYAKEVEAVLRGEQSAAFFKNMYGNQPDNWSPHLQGWDRLRFITNCFTRMRYCYADGRLDMSEKNSPDKASAELIPWYDYKERKTLNEKVIFGHWSTVRLDAAQDFKKLNVYPIDGGCLWGGALTALRLEDERIFSVPSRQA